MRFNSFIKLLSLTVHALMCLVGMFMVGICFYLTLADWGDLSPSFFLATGVIIGLSGCIIFFVSKIGRQGIASQMRTFGWLSGQKIITFYIIIEVLLLSFVLFLIDFSRKTLLAFSKNYKSLNDGVVDVPFAPLEHTLADKFNSFFFGAATGCRVDYVWFWEFVDRVCPSQLSSLSCQACYTYSITMCLADESSCYSDNSIGHDSDLYCPYTLCRAELLQFLGGNAVTRCFLGILISFALLQLVNILLNIRLATFQFRNVGTIKVVPIVDDVDIVVVTAPPVRLHSQQQHVQQPPHLDYYDDSPML